MYKPITQIMKTNIKKFTYFPLTLALLAFFSCEDNSGQIESLTKENTELNDQYRSQLLETRMVTKEVDSLTTVVHKLQSKVNKLAGAVPVYKASNQDEEAIEVLVNNIHKGWASMTKTNDTNKLLQYFLPKYTTSAVRINTDNIPSVQRSNDSNFEEHLQELMLSNNLSVSFGQTKFLYTEVKGKFFVTSYRTRIRVYNNNKQVYTSSLVTQLAGENNDGWKVGNYAWVTFNY